MAAIAATSYATPSANTWAVRARLDQARRDADQAQARARQLRAQADQAEQQAQNGRARARSISAELAQADSTYGTAPGGSVAAHSGRFVNHLV
jgi:multidrug resistance efflux pump